MDAPSVWLLTRSSDARCRKVVDIDRPSIAVGKWRFKTRAGPLCVSMIDRPVAVRAKVFLFFFSTSFSLGFTCGALTSPPAPLTAPAVMSFADLDLTLGSEAKENFFCSCFRLSYPVGRFFSARGGLVASRRPSGFLFFCASLFPFFLFVFEEGVGPQKPFSVCQIHGRIYARMLSDGV